ncbi:RNA polymerase sigma factor [Henriciella aquimarina]|uniref:RNA polymerase sigma factor n=1 Tax=Henriciella aquimarina TaxID=545261 RepID=UPI001301B21B|nr:sigma-70 family RNA polymerase sigma factor [Henriciella aquimarina]
MQAVFSGQREQLLRLARLRVGNRADAEDLVQEAFVAVGRAYPDREGEELRRLLFVTLRNLTVNFLKSGYRRQARASVEFSGVGEVIACARTATPERQLMDAQLLRIAEQAIAALPERRREALRLHRYEGLTYSQVARRLSVSVRTAKSDVAEALAAIAERLSRLEGGGDPPAG